MAAITSRNRATLADLPTDFSVSFLKNSMISLKSKQKGFKYFSEGFFHSVTMFINRGTDDVSCISVSAKSYRSQRKSEEPHSLHIDIKPNEISEAHCSCQAGYVKFLK